MEGVNVLTQAAVGSLVGVMGTGLGGLICYYVRPAAKTLAFLMTFSAGLMLSISTIDLIPQSIKYAGAWSVAYMLLGILLVVGLSKALDKAGKGSSRMIRTGILVGISIAIHNLPEGLAIGSGFASPDGIGAGLAVVILLHNIPEGLSMGIPLKAGGMGAPLILITMASGLPEGIGAAAGFLLGGISNMLYGGCMGFAGGAMIVVLLKLIKEAWDMHSGFFTAMGVPLGIAAGAGIAMLL